MGRLVHFEIHVNNMDRAKKFYADVFGWTFEDYSEYTGMPYFAAVTGDDTDMGINGALMQRQGPVPEENQPVNGFTCTMIVDDYDASKSKILKSGGKETVSKYALPGMAWQGYYLDTEGNVFGIHQPDEDAK